MTYSYQQLQRLALGLHRRYPRFGEGMHLGSKAGIGLNPLPAREFTNGDSMRRMAWPETLRLGKPMVRQYAVEFDAVATIVCDLSERSDWGGPKALELKSDLARYTAEAVTQLLLWNGDRVGHLLAGASIRTTRATRDESVRFRLRRLLDDTPMGSDELLPAALRRLSVTPSKRELVIVISDFLGEGWQRPLRAVAHRNDVIAIQTIDPCDRELDENLGEMLVGVGGRTVRVNPRSARTRATYRAVAEEQQRMILSTMRSAGARHFVLDTSRPLIDQLVRGVSRQSS